MIADIPYKVRSGNTTRPIFYIMDSWLICLKYLCSREETLRMEKYKGAIYLDDIPSDSPTNSKKTTLKMVSKILLSLGFVAAAANAVFGHPMEYGNHDIRPQQQQPISVHQAAPGAPGGDGETTADAVFAGIPTFAHLPYEQCFTDSSADFDIAFIGAPFDTGSYQK